MVSTLDSESSDPSSHLGRTFNLIFIFFERNLSVIPSFSHYSKSDSLLVNATVSHEDYFSLSRFAFTKLSSVLWRTASLRSAPHQQTPEPVYIVVDKLVHCDPNMYS